MSAHVTAGQRLWSLTAVDPSAKGGSWWVFVCDCGAKIEAPDHIVSIGNRRSCGCKKKRTVVSAGDRFGKLTVVSMLPPGQKGGAACWCRCDCGRERSVRTRHLVSGHSASCKCTNRPPKKQEWNGTKRHPLYSTWLSMIQRCENPNVNFYARYGGRGIRVCPRWRQSFAAFLEDVGERPTSSHQLDRINNDGNYEPGNCRWATPSENRRNRNSSMATRARVVAEGEWCRVPKTGEAK